MLRQHKGEQELVGFDLLRGQPQVPGDHSGERGRGRVHRSAPQQGERIRVRKKMLKSKCRVNTVGSIFSRAVIFGFFECLPKYM